MTVTASLLGALRPGSPTFSESNQRDVKKRGKGPTQDPRINIAESPKKFLGITRFGEILNLELGSCASCRGPYCFQVKLNTTLFFCAGFSKQNEVFVGRTAQLGFLAGAHLPSIQCVVSYYTSVPPLFRD